MYYVKIVWSFVKPRHFIIVFLYVVGRQWFIDLGFEECEQLGTLNKEKYWLYKTLGHYLSLTQMTSKLFQKLFYVYL